MRRHEEEPEWFTSGPVSQTDVIELRGFDTHEGEDNEKEVKQHEEKGDTKQSGKDDNERQGIILPSH